MLFLFTVAFIVTLIAAVYMQFGSQAERYVMQYKLNADAFGIFGSSFIFMLCLNGLRDSGLGFNTALCVLFFCWIPTGCIAIKVEKIQQSFQSLYEIGKELNSKREKVGMKEHHAVLFFIEMERINNGQKNRVHRAILAYKRYYN